jgi:hypothetical protein
MSSHPWVPTEIDLNTILAKFPRPLDALASSEVPAFIIRRAFDPMQCEALIRRFYNRGLLYDPRKLPLDQPKGRVDIGASAAGIGDPKRFFENTARAHKLFETLFEGYPNPIKVIYDTLSVLAPGKHVMTAHEADGRMFGPAIFRCYYEDRGHGPHFDSTRNDRLQDSSRGRSAVGRFETQFSAVMCFQNAARFEGDDAGQAFIYREQWSPDLKPNWNKTYREEAANRGIERAHVNLNQGDLYVFCTEHIHEVPPVRGDTPRITLAAFFGSSKNDDEIFVWS